MIQIKKDCKHYKDLPLKSNNRHYVNSIQYDNCILCLINDTGAMTQQQIADYLDYSKMRICQIEKSAISKLLKRIDLTLIDYILK